MTALLLLLRFGQTPRPRRVRRARGWRLAGWVARTVLYAVVVDRAGCHDP